MPLITITLNTGTNTWTVPADWNNSNNTVSIYGAGFAGGHGATGGSGGGGSGNDFARNNNVSLTPGQIINVAVGQGGNAANIIAGTQDSWFISNTILFVSGESNAASVGTIIETGGNTTPADANMGSGGGGAGDINGPGSIGQIGSLGGAGGAPGGGGFGGAGGAGGGFGGAGVNGSIYGGGGGGGGRASAGTTNGGNGANAAIIIQYTPVQGNMIPQFLMFAM